MGCFHICSCQTPPKFLVKAEIVDSRWCLKVNSDLHSEFLANLLVAGFSKNRDNEMPKPLPTGEGQKWQNNGAIRSKTVPRFVDQVEFRFGWDMTFYSGRQDTRSGSLLVSSGY